MVWIIQPASLCVCVCHNQWSFDRVAQQGIEPTAQEVPISKLQRSTPFEFLETKSTLDQLALFKTVLSSLSMLCCSTITIMKALKTVQTNFALWLTWQKGKWDEIAHLHEKKNTLCQRWTWWGAFTLFGTSEMHNIKILPHTHTLLMCGGKNVGKISTSLLKIHQHFSNSFNQWKCCDWWICSQVRSKPCKFVTST